MKMSIRKGYIPVSTSLATLNNNAEDEGFRAAYVYIEFPGDRAHSVAAFDTVDRGLIFIEPQYDDEVEL